ncbi:ABC transporter permease [Sedimentibacter hydroxybenzoicus DSM 7310]|uniref:ABC transporter permease n=1 Tax=Sedimentibacter hydroxybenzoicus DSM 7310 TaxID=1123245 RepID=A0A974BMT5_SEDHY|nr:ABC transporter permease [Sedimentibacter hydroxybenzoicus]NYB75485.1 ABC transporter permease [Sedimentibacter hydroxybenzoicus DSM 7310]
MRGIYHQLKNIRRDKMCILSFLLPVIVGLAINLLSDVSFSTLGETAFGIVQNDLTEEMADWVEQNGSVTVYEDMEGLQMAVIDPATQMIGVVRDSGTIKSILSGDEFQLYKTIGDKLPQLFEEREAMRLVAVEARPAQSDSLWPKSLLIVITMVTAMFMGCTFNAMSIIGEKEDGISFINEILPMTQQEYVFQKISLGLVGGILSTIATAFACMKIEIEQLFPLLLLIVLSAFISALIGMYIGRFSSGLMAGIVYIKMIMILFIAPPILFYLMIPADSIGRILSYLLPSSAAFYGLMDLVNGRGQNISSYFAVLLIHCVVWMLFYFITSSGSKNSTE